MKKEESDLKIMEEMERKELQDRYIRFDWAIKRLLRQKANFDVLDASANLTRAQASLTGARADYLTALAQIYVAMGEYHPDLGRR